MQDDEARVRALRRLDVLDTAPEEPFEKIVTLVRTVLAVPIATVSLVDRDRQWFKAQRGFDRNETPRSGSFCTYAIQQPEPLIIEDALTDERFATSPFVAGPPNIRSYAGVQLRTPDGYNIGSLCAMDTRVRRFSPADIAILSNFANIVCDELELRMIAQHDYLTGALSRRGFIEQAQREMARQERYGRPIALIALDIDHFKRINDGHGHAAGDEVLRQVGAIMANTLRPSDVYGRLGGEEFGILLPETDLEQAAQAAERLRSAVEEHDFAVGGDASLRVTVSMGLVALDPGTDTLEVRLAEADRLLYQAKAAGRNRVVAADAARD